MHNFGTKFRVLNSSTDFKVYSDNTYTTTLNAAAIAALVAPYTAVLKVEGFGAFPLSAMTAATTVAGVSPVAEVTTHAVTVPSGSVAGETVEVLIDFKTSRYQSELKNNYISGGRPVIFSSAPIAAPAGAAEIAAAIETGFNNFISHFHIADNVPFTVTAAGTDIVVTMKAGFESVSINTANIRRVDGLSSDYPLVLLTKTITTPGEEGIGTGKFLEESVQAATWANENPYGIDTVDTRVDLRGLYTEFFVDYDAAYDKTTIGAPSPGINLSGTSKMDFAIFLNEASAATAIAEASAIAGII